jgi:hypothetical protein
MFSQSWYEYRDLPNCQKTHSVRLERKKKPQGVKTARTFVLGFSLHAGARQGLAGPAADVRIVTRERIPTFVLPVTVGPSVGKRLAKGFVRHTEDLPRLTGADLGWAI